MILAIHHPPTTLHPVVPHQWQYQFILIIQCEIGKHAYGKMTKFHQAIPHSYRKSPLLPTKRKYDSGVLLKHSFLTKSEIHRKYEIGGRYFLSRYKKNFMDEKFKNVRCKNCDVKYSAEIAYYTRKDGRRVFRIYPYCSVFCYREWYHKTTGGR